MTSQQQSNENSCHPHCDDCGGQYQYQDVGLSCLVQVNIRISPYRACCVTSGAWSMAI